MSEQIIQWHVSDLKWDSCEQIAKECRESGLYDFVEIRKRKPENGVRFGKVFVRRKEPHPLSAA